MASPDGVSRVVRHRDFYLRGGDMTVQVENHLYRIHSFFFYRESPFFRQMFHDSDAGVGEERGSTDQNAYTLEDIRSEDFARFLWVFYNPKYSVYDAPLEAWLKIIQLADRWTFDDVKELSVRELEKIEMDPVEKIAIYQDNKISRLYLVPSYIAVSKRDQPLTLSEANKLGMETVIRLAEARERLRQQAFGRGIRSPTSEDFDDAAVETLVREIFHLGPRRSAPTPAPTTPTLTPTPVTPSTNGTSHSAVRADPTPPANPPRANGAPPARVSSAWTTEPRGSSLDPSSASTTSAPASTIPTHTGNGSTTNGRTNNSNTTNGHASNATNSASTTSAANATNGRTTNTSTSASTSSSATGSKVSGSGLNRVNFPNTTFRQAKEQLRGGSLVSGK